jgi:hypothetical protein
MQGTEIDRDEEIRRLAYKFGKRCPDGYSSTLAQSRDNMV